MKKKVVDTAKTIAILLVLLIITRMIPYLPWWSFVIPVLFLGILISIRKWQVPAFLTGFFAGFLVWLGANIYFDMTFNNITLDKIGHLLSVSKGIVMLISGLVGGLLTGLALYTGKTVVLEEEQGLVM